MRCAYRHRRAVGDTFSLFTLQLLDNGEPVDLNDKKVQLVAFAEDGTKVIDEEVAIDDPDNGHISYDFQIENFAHAQGEFNEEPSLEQVTYRGYLQVFEAPAGQEPDTYPVDSSIELIFFNPAFQRTTPDPSSLSPADLMEAAKAPRRSRTVEGTVEERSIDQLIKADQYISSKGSGDAAPWGIRLAKTRPPSSMS